VVCRRDVRQGHRRVTYVYRAVDQHGQVIDVLPSPRPPAGSSPGRCGR
jgi:hypothetical protein